MSHSPRRLLSDDDPVPVAVLRPDGTSPFALTCQHGGRLALSIEEHRRLGLGFNEPYAISNATDVTIPVHGGTRGIVPVEIEIRQDLIEIVEGRTAWAEHLANWFFRCLENPSIMAWA